MVKISLYYNKLPQKANASMIHVIICILMFTHIMRSYVFALVEFLTVSI